MRASSHISGDLAASRHAPEHAAHPVPRRRVMRTAWTNGRNVSRAGRAFVCDTWGRGCRCYRHRRRLHGGVSCRVSSTSV
eukprot:4439593-Prymnesium_polylepis.1